MRFRVIAASLSLAVGFAPLQAQVVPTGTFGSIPANSFGGSGIPTNAVMFGTYSGVTIALSATPRYTSPVLTNDGAGSFFALPGISTGGPTNAGFAAWNFDYSVSGATTGSTPPSLFRLYVDLNPAVGNSLASMNMYSWTGNAFDSTNLHYFSPLFDANATGEYSFVLQQLDSSNLSVLDEVAINVEVGTTSTPEPASLVLLATGLIGIGGVARRRRA